MIDRIRASVDVVILSRDAGPLDDRVETALRGQVGVALQVHRVVGTVRSTDVNRWETISRARNVGKRKGQSPWVLFLDDDVDLAHDCVQTLLKTLRANASYGVCAADYQNGSSQQRNAHHVTMGATLFRRSALGLVQFRWEDDKCECQCCCDDLRKAGIGIGFVPAAKARHLDAVHSKAQSAAGPEAALAGNVFAAFDRHHYAKFRNRFLRSLRAAGNDEQVTVMAYGLYPSDERQLAYMPNVNYVGKPENTAAVPIRRLDDFQEIVAGFPAAAPVAYWDTADVLFQSSLKPLWKMVSEQPRKLMVVAEPFQHPENTAVATWTLSIHHRESREMAFRLMTENPFLNSGFAAATAATMLKYLAEGQRLRKSKDLIGTLDWGDQTALNLYCYQVPDRHQSIDEGWNFCLCGRNPHEFIVRNDGLIVGSKDGQPIPVVHGNNKTLESYWFARGFE